jgi:hypothetical protein
MANDTDLRSNFFGTITGRHGADVSGGGNVGSMLLAAFGPSKRDASRPNTAAAAKSLGVSQRTVQRWLAGAGHERQKPKATTLAKISKRARQASTTKAGRARAVAQTFGKKLPTGMRMKVYGMQGPGDPSYDRLRTVNFDLDDPNLSKGFLNAWVDGGDQGALRWLSDNAEETYGMDGWHFGRVDDVDMLGPYGRD